MKLKSLIGKKFSRLTVLKLAPSINSRTVWYCECSCGNRCSIRAESLKSGSTRSCGCIAAEILRKRNFKHGLSVRGRINYKYTLLHHAKHRAKKANMTFNLTIRDLSIPKNCPVLGIKIRRTLDHVGPGSPTVDRIDNTKGYVKGNIKVISARANRLKSDATIPELKAIISYLQGDIK